MKRVLSVIVLLWSSLLYANKYVYITDGTSLKVVDVSTPSTPVIQGSITTGSSFYVHVYQNIAYVGEFAINDPFLTEINVTDPLSPSFVRSFDKNSSLGRVTDMAMQGGILFITDEYRGIHNRDPNGTVLSTKVLLDGSDAMSITSFGDELVSIYQKNGGSWLAELDAADPNNLQEILGTSNIDAASYPYLDSSRHSFVRTTGSRIYVANAGDQKLYEYLFSSGVVAGGSIIFTNSVPTDMHITGKYILITSNVPVGHPSLPNNTYDGITVIDVTTQQITFQEVLESASGVVADSDNIVYVTDANGLHIYELDTTTGILSLITDFVDGSGNYIDYVNTVEDQNSTSETNTTVNYGGGCACTHDPDAKPDALFFFLMVLAFLYPLLKRKWGRQSL